jgi:hypothetical protein
MRRQRSSLTGRTCSADLAGSGPPTSGFPKCGRFVVAAALLADAALLASCSGSVDNNGSADPPAVGPDGMPVDESGNPLPPGVAVNPDGTPAAVGEPVTNPDGTPVTNPDGTPVINPEDTPAGTAEPSAANAGSECVPGVPGTSQLPRLTHAQYDNTIRDLVGITTGPSALLAPDTPGSVDQRAWDGYQGAAESVAAQVMADPNARAMAIPCTPSGDGLACAQQFIAEFGLRAFRRPLTPDEGARFEALYTMRDTITETGSFDEIAEVLLRALLVSPSFLTRAELTEVQEETYYKLNGYEIASRLSYMLWGSMPDDDLFAAAAGDALSTPEQILEQAARMLQSDKARNQVAAFHQGYAKMGAGTRWAEIDRDPNIYPAFSQEMVGLLSAETERLFDYTVFEQRGGFQDLLTTKTVFVNATTAPLYGLDVASYGADLEAAELTDESRLGVFTRVGFLTSFSKYDRPSPILRGAFLQKEVLCTAIPAPPDGASGAPFPTEGLATNRERTDAQTSGGDCVSCHHQVINPTGFTLEAFDAIGMARTMDNGVTVDTTANVPIDGAVVEVQGAADLMARIAESRAAQYCYAQKWVQYAYERSPNPADACVVENMAARIATGADSYSVLDLVADLTQSDSFRYRAIETEVVQ